MSQGLGRNQRLVLEALQKIEQEHPLDEGNILRVSYLLCWLYENHFRAKDEAQHAENEMRLRKETTSNDPRERGLAEAALSIRESLAKAKAADGGFFDWLMRGGNRNRRGDAADLEQQLNPSRAGSSSADGEAFG
jgi:hypothetical protein